MDRGSNNRCAAETRGSTDSDEDSCGIKPQISRDGTCAAADVAKARWTLLRQVLSVVQKENLCKFMQGIAMMC